MLTCQQSKHGKSDSDGQSDSDDKSQSSEGSHITSWKEQTA